MAMVAVIVDLLKWLFTLLSVASVLGVAGQVRLSPHNYHSRVALQPEFRSWLFFWFYLTCFASALWIASMGLSE
jgi:hypothetical protein